MADTDNITDNAKTNNTIDLSDIFFMPPKYFWVIEEISSLIKSYGSWFVSHKIIIVYLLTKEPHLYVLGFVIRGRCQCFLFDNTNTVSLFQLKSITAQDKSVFCFRMKIHTMS